MTLLISPGNSATRTVMKEALQVVLFIHLARQNLASALRTLKWMDLHNQRNTAGCPGKKADDRMLHPISDPDPQSQNRKAGRMNPGRQLWILSDGIIFPFLVFFRVTVRLILELEHDSFHTAMLSMPNDPSSAVRRKGRTDCNWCPCRSTTRAGFAAARA